MDAAISSALGVRSTSLGGPTAASSLHASRAVAAQTHELCPLRQYDDQIPRGLNASPCAPSNAPAIATRRMHEWREPPRVSKMNPVQASPRVSTLGRPRPIRTGMAFMLGRRIDQRLPLGLGSSDYPLKIAPRGLFTLQGKHDNSSSTSSRVRRDARACLTASARANSD